MRSFETEEERKKDFEERRKNKQLTVEEWLRLRTA